jgi:hypothetical protein
MANGLARNVDRRSPAVVRAGEAAAKIHAADKAEEIAKRIKDARGLEKALLQKLEVQRDFAAEYRAKFPQGGDRRSLEYQDDSPVALVAADWCLSFGFHVRTVQRWLELLDESGFVNKKNGILKKCWQLAELWQSANFMSDSVEWYTPARYIEAVRECLGGIDLDPASSAQANETVGAMRIFSHSGLERQWQGRVFTNPPYGKTDDGKSLAAAFCVKAIEEYESGNVEACIILINSLHSQTWQAPLYKYVVCFVDHRIQFISGDGEENKNPTFQNIFVYLGSDVARFANVFGKFGYVMGRIDGQQL